MTWVGKVYSILKYQKCRVGIIFSYNGFTGKDWSDAVGLSKKVNLLDGISIIDFNVFDFKRMADGYDFLSILEMKLANLQQDVRVDYTEHPAQELLGNVKSKD